MIADVFKNFRQVGHVNYGLGPCWYYSAPGLSWDALLKTSEIELELLTDIDMFNFIEKGIRGGISVIAKKYAAANNKYLQSYDKNLPSSYIIYFDCVNLYGASMGQAMPCGGFHWITPNQFLKETEKKSSQRYFIFC